ncbi:DUF6381 family protein [Streptomyces sp. NPDC001691]|uniref:DUF6381 family protein n=1 Tax=unclassified Streptomyces TaxID=2593676 RepID=UPI001674B668|nr:DUF6381 family protein [Streptomyces sp. SDr-06]
MSTTDGLGDRSAAQVLAQVKELDAAALRAQDPAIRQVFHDKARRLQEENERRHNSDGD